MITQKRSRRKSSGGRYKDARKKRLIDEGRTASLTKVGETRAKKIRARGGNDKIKLFSSDAANVFDSKTRKYSKAKIIRVVENPANRHHTRRNIMTKGTIIETDKGNAKITTRPGQEGNINAVLIQ